MAERDTTDQFGHFDGMVTAILGQLPLAVFVLDSAGRPAYANAAARALLGQDIDRSIGVAVLAERYAAFRAGTDEPYPAAEMPVVLALGGEDSIVTDMELETPNGRVRLEVHGAPIRDQNGEVLYAVASFQDVTERTRAAEILDALARRSSAIMAAGSEGTFALDRSRRFTYVNSTAAEYLGYTGESLVGRPVGEILHPDHLDALAAQGAASAGSGDPRREEFMRADGMTLAVHCSVVSIGEHDDAEGVVVTFSPIDLTVADRELAKNAGELREAIRDDQLVLFYQPKIDFGTGACYGVEALVRWNHPVRGMVYPDDFIDMAERSGTMSELTNWVFHTAVRQRRKWQDEGIHLTMSVNLSASSLGDDSILELVSATLAEFGVSPRAVEVELTETAVMQDPVVALRVLSRLAAIGVLSSIDDFGTGFSSLVYLRELPVETIKIDKSFVMRMDVDEKDKAIVNSTINLARSLGKKVVAEGVENERIADLLRELGCDSGQGYYWTRPIPAEAFLSWLTEARLAPATAQVPALQVAGDHRLIAALLDVSRAILRAREPADLKQALVLFVERLGGSVTSADVADPDALHWDLSLGESEAVVPVAAPGALPRRLIEVALPEVLADAGLVLDRLQNAKPVEKS